MVLGEASESEDESDGPNSKETSLSGSQSVGSFLPNNASRAGPKKSSRHKLKYNTLLHYRLRKHEKLQVIEKQINILSLQVMTILL